MRAFRGKTHILIGTLIGLLIIRITKMSLEINTFLFIGGVLIGSLLPDVDHKNARIGRFIPLWRFLKHRTLTHSIWIVLLMVLITKVQNYIGYGLFVGVTTHILADLFSMSGCCFFFPLLKHPQQFAEIKTNSKEEDKIRIIVGALLIIVIGVYALDLAKYLSQGLPF
ncbi:MAG: metal-dependent hydrolase [Clostridiaceae bacterium]|nr:metal-dependent hydrolase [Clostridiaceae bacterium]